MAAWSSSSTNRRRSTSWWTRGRSANAARGSSCSSSCRRRASGAGSSDTVVGHVGARLHRHAGPGARLVGGEVAHDAQQVPLGPLGVAHLGARGERAHHGVLGEVLGVGVVAAERAGVAEDVGAVLDHDLAEVDDVVADSVPPARIGARLPRSPPDTESRRTVHSGHPAGNGIGGDRRRASTLAAVARVLVTRQLPEGGLDPLVAAGHELVQRAGDEPLHRRRAGRRWPPRSTRSSASSPTASTPPCSEAGAPRLRVVANVAVGYDNIDVADRRGARHRGVQHARRARRDHRRPRVPPVLAAARRASDAEADLRAGPLDRLPHRRLPRRRRARRHARDRRVRAHRSGRRPTRRGVRHGGAAPHAHRHRHHRMGRRTSTTCCARVRHRVVARAAARRDARPDRRSSARVDEADPRCW